MQLFGEPAGLNKQKVRLKVVQTGNRLENKVSIITGAANGIGLGIALRYCREGTKVVVNDVNQAVAEAVAREITTVGGKALARAADVSNKEQVAHIFGETLKKYGTVDILVNNASLTITERHFLEADSAWWNSILAVNLSAAFLCSLRAVRLMAPRHAGVIINMSSGGASRAHRGNAAYDAA